MEGVKSENENQFDLINDDEINKDYREKNNNINNDIRICFNDEIQLDYNGIYKENKRRNKLKIETTEFMSYIIKVELLFQTLQGHLYWVSGIELFIFIILFFLFCSSPKNMSTIWWYIFHLFRGSIGLIIIKNLPKTFEVIDNLKVIPDILNELKKSLIKIFLELLVPLQKKLKLLLIVYFGLTVFCTIIDIMVFCVFAPDCGIKGAEKPFLFMILSSLIYIYCDIIYYNFFSSFKFYFDKTQQANIQRATVIGFFDQLKIGMAKKIVSITKKINDGINNHRKNDNFPTSKEPMNNKYHYERDNKNKNNIDEQYEVKEVNIMNDA